MQQPCQSKSVARAKLAARVANGIKAQSYSHQNVATIHSANRILRSQASHRIATQNRIIPNYRPIFVSSPHIRFHHQVRLPNLHHSQHLKIHSSSIASAQINNSASIPKSAPSLCLKNEVIQLKQLPANISRIISSVQPESIRSSLGGLITEMCSFTSGMSGSINYIRTNWQNLVAIKDFVIHEYQNHSFCHEQAELALQGAEDVLQAHYDKLHRDQLVLEKCISELDKLATYYKCYSQDYAQIRSSLEYLHESVGEMKQYIKETYDIKDNHCQTIHSANFIHDIDLAKKEVTSQQEIAQAPLAIQQISEPVQSACSAKATIGIHESPYQPNGVHVPWSDVLNIVHEFTIDRIPNSPLDAMSLDEPPVVSSRIDRIISSNWLNIQNLGFSADANYLNRNWKDLYKIVSDVSNGALNRYYTDLRNEQYKVYKAIYAIDNLLADYSYCNENNRAALLNAKDALITCFNIQDQCAQCIEGRYDCPPAMRLTVESLYQQEMSQEIYNEHIKYLKNKDFNVFVSQLKNHFLSIGGYASWGDGSRHVGAKMAEHEILSHDFHKAPAINIAVVQPIKSSETMQILAVPQDLQAASAAAAASASDPVINAQAAELSPFKTNFTLADIRHEVALLEGRPEFCKPSPFKSFAETARGLLDLGDRLERTRSQEHVQQLYRDAVIWIDQASVPNAQNTSISAELCNHLKPLIREGIIIQDPIQQEFFVDVVDTATCGASIVRAFESMGEFEQAKVLNAAIKSQLEMIKRLDLVATSKQNDPFNIAQPGPELSQAMKNMEAVMLGCGDAVIGALDPRTYVVTAVQLAYGAHFVLSQFSRLVLAQEAWRAGNRQFAQQLMDTFHAENARVVSATKKFIEDFKNLPQDEQIRILTCVSVSVAAAKPLAALQTTALNVCLGGCGRVASLVGKQVGKCIQPLRESPYALGAAEGMHLPVNPASEFEAAAAAREGAEFCAAEKAVGSSCSHQLKRAVTWKTKDGFEVSLKMDAKIANAFEKYGAEGVEEISRGATQIEVAAVKGQELIGPKVQTFEQARNIALEIAGDMGANTQPYIGTLSKSAGFGKIVGRVSADNKALWRLDWDAIKGMHLHVEDYRFGKGIHANNYVIPFEGSEEMFKSLIGQLNR